jgi:NAD(P)H-dependent FMN reductase
MKQLIIVGTAREGSKTGLVADAVREEFSEGNDVKVFDLKDREVPSMERMLQHDETPPEDVKEFAELVNWCEMLTLISPEYNHSYPGVLKNCLDYLYSEYGGKAFSYVTVSGGGFGGVRSQSHLHDLTLALGGRPGPSLHVSRVGDHFSEEKVSEEYIDRIKTFRDNCREFL